MHLYFCQCFFSYISLILNLYYSTYSLHIHISFPHSLLLYTFFFFPFAFSELMRILFTTFSNVILYWKSLDLVVNMFYSDEDGSYECILAKLCWSWARRSILWSGNVFNHQPRGWREPLVFWLMLPLVTLSIIIFLWFDIKTENNLSIFFLFEVSFRLPQVHVNHPASKEGGTLRTLFKHDNWRNI